MNVLSFLSSTIDIRSNAMNIYVYSGIVYNLFDKGQYINIHVIFIEKMNYIFRTIICK